MSIQFGVLNLNGEPVQRDSVAQARANIARYAHDEITAYIDGNVGLLYSEFRTVSRRKPQIQTHISASGTICIWDGRLDNTAELARAVGDGLDAESPEVEIVAACYNRCGLRSLAGLLGDWALTIWDPLTRSLVLAKDFLGTRHLYYRVEAEQITWSTVLDPLVLRAAGALTLDEQYLAGCLSFLPATHLTPYAEIRSVPPASYVLLKPKRQEIQQYWHFNPDNTVRYRTDSEYEEHFVDSFGQSVRRRLRSDAPILAELSGGVDSSSIVCVADRLITGGTAQAPELHTISYYSTREPDWDERPFFHKIEEHRGRTGFHVDLGPCGFFQFGFENTGLAVVPDAARSSKADREITRYLQSTDHRVMLSGLGGDEVAGGVPTPIPELANLLATGDWPSLAHRLKVWALQQRKPWLHLLAETCRQFLSPTLASTPRHARPAAWVNSTFIRRQRPAMLGYSSRLRLFGPLPSFQQNLHTLDALRRRVAWSALSPEFPCEKRYPYLDRDFLEFLLAVPPEQLVRPGQRRSLMRRALRGIVPHEVLDRKRKAFVSRAPRLAIKEQWNYLTQCSFVSASLGIVDSVLLIEAMKQVCLGKDIALIPLMRSLVLECWLRHLADRNICKNLTTEQRAAAALLSWGNSIAERR